MERLTSDKKVSEMGIVELAYNCCYAKDGAARYRDYDLDMDARVLATKLMRNLANSDDAFTSDEDFDNYMIECLSEGFDSIEGLIALLYRHMWAMASLWARLKYYEDQQEAWGMLERMVDENDVSQTCQS